MKYQSNGKLAHNEGKKMANTLHTQGYSRAGAKRFMLNKGVSEITVKRALRFVYGGMEKRGRPRKFKGLAPVIEQAQKQEHGLALREFCLVPSIDLGVLSARYQKVYFEVN